MYINLNSKKNTSAKKTFTQVCTNNHAFSFKSTTKLFSSLNEECSCWYVSFLSNENPLAAQFPINLFALATEHRSICCASSVSSSTVLILLFFIILKASNRGSGTGSFMSLDPELADSSSPSFDFRVFTPFSSMTRQIAMSSSSETEFSAPWKWAADETRYLDLLDLFPFINLNLHSSNQTSTPARLHADEM